MKLETAQRKHATAWKAYRAAGRAVDQAIRAEREAGRTIPELMKLTGLSYRGVYLALERSGWKPTVKAHYALNRTDERNGK
jgi:hypothetical protein